MSHTPGPWKVWKGHTDVYANVGQNTPGMIEGYCVAVCDPDDIEADSDGEALRIAKANARLIASAPDLLDATESLLHWLREFYPDEPLFSTDRDKQNVTISWIENAMRKAKGGL